MIFAAEVIPTDVTVPDIITWSGVAAVPIVAGVVQVFIQTGLPKTYAAIVALLLGVLGGIITATSTGLSLITGVTQGITVGLAAAGFWHQIAARPNGNGGNNAIGSSSSSGSS